MANNSKTLEYVFGGAVVDEVRRQFPLGHDHDATAEAGAARSVVELRLDLQHSFACVEAVWQTFDDRLWDRHGGVTPGVRTMAQIVARHLRDVEVHHVDLDIGYGIADWPPRFVDEELPKRLSDLPARVDHNTLLAWLLGRAPAPELGPW